MAERPSASDIAIIRKRESLLLSRTRVSHDLECCQNDRYKLILSKALADLDVQLARLR